MWARLKDWRLIKDGEKELKSSVQEGIDEEYLSAFKTKSYVEFFTKAQTLLNNQPSSSSSSFCCCNISDVLLKPGQEAVATILDETILLKNPNLKILIHNYFNISAEASKICSRLLTSIKQVKSNYKYIQRVLTLLKVGVEGEFHCSPQDWNKLVVFSQLSSFSLLKNPFSNTNSYDFKLVHDRYSSLLSHLKVKRKKIFRKIKMIKYFKKGTEFCITTACGVVAAATIALAAHTLLGLVIGPVIFSLPMKKIRKKKKKVLTNFGSLHGGYLRKLYGQLDVVAKGAYILNNDFDTMSRLVARIDEIEHSKAIVNFWLERKENEFLLQEVVNELKKSDMEFKKQVKELEVHVYLCFVTINKARSLVVNEMARASTLWVPD